MVHLTIPLDGRGRVALLAAPTPLTSHDVQCMRAWLDLLATTVEDEPGEPDPRGPA